MPGIKFPTPTVDEDRTVSRRSDARSHAFSSSFCPLLFCFSSNLARIHLDARGRKTSRVRSQPPIRAVSHFDLNRRTFEHIIVLKPNTIERLPIDLHASDILILRRIILADQTQELSV